MLKRTSTPSRKDMYVPEWIEGRPSALQSKKKSVCVQKHMVEKSCSSDVQASSYLHDILARGQNMNDSDFDKFIKVHARDCYWEILAERARIQLEDQLRDNQQLHDILEELTKENEQLQMKTEQSEYLTNLFNSIMSDYDSGIELHTMDESSASKRQK